MLWSKWWPVVLMICLASLFAYGTRYQYISTSGPNGLPSVYKVNRWTEKTYLLMMNEVIAVKQGSADDESTASD
jgi:hypothetical protein